MADFNLSQTGTAVQRILNKVASWITDKIQTSDIADEAVTNGKLTTTLQTSIAAVANKSDIIDLTGYISAGAVLPQNGTYLYKGYPTHAVKGYTDNNVYYLAFCYEHESEGDYKPQNHNVIVYTRSDSGYIYNETFNTDEAETDLEVNITRALTAYVVTEKCDGLMSAQDKVNLDSLVSKISNVYAVLNDMLDKGVFTDKITASLYGITAICGKAVCGKAVCGNNQN